MGVGQKIKSNIGIKRNPENYALQRIQELFPDIQEEDLIALRDNNPEDFDAFLLELESRNKNTLATRSGTGIPIPSEEEYKQYMSRINRGWLRYMLVGALNWGMTTQISVFNFMLRLSFPWAAKHTGGIPNWRIPNQPPSVPELDKNGKPKRTKKGEVKMRELTPPEWARLTSQAGGVSARFLGFLINRTQSGIKDAKGRIYR